MSGASAGTLHNRPQRAGIFAHTLTWGIVAVLYVMAWIVHLLGASDSGAGEMVRVVLRAGDPRGPSTEGAFHYLFLDLILLVTAFALGYRYVNGLFIAALIVAGTAVFYAPQTSAMASLIQAAHPDFPATFSGSIGSRIASSLCFTLIGCLFGYGHQADRREAKSARC